MRQQKVKVYDCTKVTYFPNLAELYGELFNMETQGNA